MASLYEQQQQLQLRATNITMMDDQNHHNMHNNVANNMITTPMTSTYATTEIYPMAPVIINHCSGAPTSNSLSEAPACSSMGVKTPDVHPVPDITLPLVTQTVSYGDVMYNHQHLTNNHELPPYVLHDPVVVWPNPTTATTAATADSNSMISMENYSAQLSRSSSIISINSAVAQQHQNQYVTCTSMVDSPSPSASSLSADDMLYQLDTTSNLTDQQMILPQHQILEGEQENLIASTRSNRRYTVSFPPSEKMQMTPVYIKDEETTMTEKELRRQSMNDLPNSFCHLSREQLIERVVQLEKEKQLTSSKLLLESKPSVATSTEFKNTLLLDSNNNSDEDDCNHNCLWAGCGTSGLLLDQLINHIKDVHIGGGKAAYYCEWINCSREKKPFLKRHKMQNHMRTHTGERPFECPIEDCDKKFSRQDSLNTHIKTHSSIRPYACPVESCGKAYFHSRSLRKHAKSHEVAMISAEKNHPYDRSLKPPTKYHQSCGTTTAITATSTPTSTTTNTFYITPITTTATAPPPSTPIIIQQQQQQQQQQQIFAAGPAYVPYINHHQLQQQHYYAQPFIVSNNHAAVTHPSYATDTFYEQRQYTY